MRRQCPINRHHGGSDPDNIITTIPMSETSHKILIAILSLTAISGLFRASAFRHEADPADPYVHMEASELYDKGHAYEETNPDSAVFYYDLASEFYTPRSGADEARACASALLAKGKILYSHFSYSRAMETLLKCRRICEDRHMPALLSEVLRYIGNIYSMHNDYERAIGFYSKSYAVADSIKDPRLTHMVLSNLVGAHIFSGNLQKADEYYTAMMRNKCRDIHYTYDVLMDGGLLAMEKGDAREALHMFTEASAYAYKHKLGTPKIGAPNSWIARLYERKGELDSSLYYFKQNERLGQEGKQTDLLVETYHGLSEIYKRKGDRINYLKYLEDYLNLSNELFNQSVFNSLKNTQFEYEMEQNERVIKDITLDREAKQASITRMWVIIIVIVVALFVLSAFFVIIMRQKRKLTDAYSDLYSRNLANLENDNLYKQRIRELQSYIDSQTEVAETGGAIENDSETSCSVTGNVSEAGTCKEAGNPDKDEAADADGGDSKAAEAEGVVPSELPTALRERLIRGISECMDNAENYCDCSFNIKTLADRVGSNTTYVSKVINETYGMNFRSFLSEYRIKESMRRLAKDSPYSGYTIKAISESVGFKSQSAFITAFTRYTGMKPSVYQDMARR